MNFLLILLAVLVEISIAAYNWTAVHEVCGISSSDRIIGGTAARIGQFPWIAHIGILRKEGSNSTLR